MPRDEFAPGCALLENGAKKKWKDGARRLRVHHVLCLPLYRGNGYSDAFCENMEQTIRWLRAYPDEPVLAVCEHDMVCAGCPNLTAWNGCRSSGRSVDEKDRNLARLLGICPGQKYTWRELLSLAEKNLTAAEFEASCRNCEWYEKGLCLYEKWKDSAQI